MSLTPEPDERRGAFEDLAAKLKEYEAEGANVKGGKVATEEELAKTDELFEGLTPGEAMFRVAMVRKALREIPDEVWHLVALARDLAFVTARRAEKPDSLAVGVAYDTARGNLSIALRRELRDPDAFSKALVALHEIRQEVRRERPT